jgi:hypothetical protein
MATVDLAALEHKLNADEKQRDAFLKDPAAYFAEYGLKVAPEAEGKLREMAHGATAGSAAALKSAAKARVDVEVSVRIRF